MFDSISTTTLCTYSVHSLFQNDPQSPIIEPGIASGSSVGQADYFFEKLPEKEKHEVYIVSSLFRFPPLIDLIVCCIDSCFDPLPPTSLSLQRPLFNLKPSLSGCRHNTHTSRPLSWHCGRVSIPRTSYLMCARWLGDTYTPYTCTHNGAKRWAHL